MSDSDDPCDDITYSPEDWIGWVRPQDKKSSSEVKETVALNLKRDYNKCMIKEERLL